MCRLLSENLEGSMGPDNVMMLGLVLFCHDFSQAHAKRFSSSVLLGR